METKQKSPKIIELMGKESKEQTKKTHLAVVGAFGAKKRNGKTNRGR